MRNLFIAALTLLLLSACGSRLDGTYTDAMGISTYTFKLGGKVSVVTMEQARPFFLSDSPMRPTMSA